MLEQYINTNPITVNIIDKEDINKKEVITIKFPDKWIDTGNKKQSNISGLFNNKSASSGYNEDIKQTGNIYNINHMNLLPYFTIEEVKYMVCSFLRYDINSIIRVYTNEDDDYVLSEDKERCKGFKWIHMDKRLTDYNAFESCISIGYKQLFIDIDKTGKILNNNYDYKFYNNYCKIQKYIKTMIDNNKTFNINKESILNLTSVQNLEVMLIYGADKETEMINEINITKLFNMLHVSNNLKKILINDNLLTEFNNEDREIQYIKTPSDIEDSFKNTFSRYNCCSVYVVNEIFPSITLSRVEIYKNGVIKCCFIINDPELEEHIIKDVINNYFNREKGKFWKLFKKIHIEECIYSYNYDINNYIPQYGNISYIIMLENIKTKNFKNSFNLVEQEIPTMIYKTNSSTFLNVYSSFNKCSFYSYYYSRCFRNLVTNLTAKSDILTHIHLQALDTNELVFYLTRCSSKDDLYMNALLILPLFNIDQKAKEKEDDFNNLPLEEKYKRIKKKYQKIPTKKALKKLIEIDPVLFGNRKINDTEVRPYSALAQKREQRVVSITKQEYDTVYKINPEYVANIKNQSQGNQRLYLFCPFDKFQHLNFHHYHNQLCIPKCTTAITKRSQYMYCNEQLDTKGAIDTGMSDSSKMIVFYSPLLQPGRKCKPPDELFMICENYILYKLELNINLLKYSLDNYNLPPYIITRDNINKVYYINTEIEKNQDYILYIQSELDSGYYLVINEENGSPFMLSEHSELFMFLKSIQTDNNTGYEFFNFIDNVLKLNISKDYEKKTFKTLINELYEIHNYKYITNLKNTRVLGIRKDNMLLMTPQLVYDKNTLSLNEEKINIVLPISTFPDIKQFESKFIKTYYKDYEDNKIHIIEYMGVDVIVKPFDEEEITNSTANIILFDYEAYYNFYLFSASGRQHENNFIKYQESQQLTNIIYTLIYIYFNTVKDANINGFIKKLEELKILHDSTTIIQKIDEKAGIVSWRTTKINKNELIKVLETIDITDFKTLTNVIYNELYNTLNIYSIRQGETIKSKIITNNTL